MLHEHLRACFSTRNKGEMSMLIMLIIFHGAFDPITGPPRFLTPRGTPIFEKCTIWYTC